MDEQNIDLRIGEARVIKDITCKLFDLNKFTINFENNDWDYQSHGYLPLVKFLSEQHDAPVVITNGANQALFAAISVLKKKEFNNLGFRIPYWNRIPEIAKSVGIGFTPFTGYLLDNSSKPDSYLVILPNNPDGYLPRTEGIKYLQNYLKDKKIPLIHDGAYYTRTYLPNDFPIDPIGDMQIFSASKTFGLSSLRIGYIVVHNQDFLKDLLDYMELYTVGVSVAAQKLFLHILQKQTQIPALKQEFETLTRSAIKKAQAVIKTIKPELLELYRTSEMCGMFGWVKPKSNDLFEKAKVTVLPGTLFGAPGFARINLGGRIEILEQAVKQINAIEPPVDDEYDGFGCYGI